MRWSYVATMSLESAVTASVVLAQDANGRQLLPGRTGFGVRMPSCALNSTLHHTSPRRRSDPLPPRPLPLSRAARRLSGTLSSCLTDAYAC